LKIIQSNLFLDMQNVDLFIKFAGLTQKWSVLRFIGILSKRILLGFLCRTQKE
jgi:hypothetical protein